LRTDVVNVGVDPPGRDNLAFPGDDLGSGANDDIDVRLHVRITGLAYRGDMSAPDSDISLDDSPMIENECVGDDRIHGSFGPGALRLTHAVANHFPAPEPHLLAIGRVVLLHLNGKIRVREADSVPNRRPEYLGVGGAAHDMGHFR